MKTFNCFCRSCIRGYQLFVSPLFFCFGARCRFHPSCSRFAMECIEELGAFRAIPRIVGRVLRCQPFCKGGLDPVARNG